MNRKFLYTLGGLILAGGIGLFVYRHFSQIDVQADVVNNVPSPFNQHEYEPKPHVYSPLEKAISDFASQNESASHSDVVRFANKKLEEMGYEMEVHIEKFETDNDGDFIVAKDGSKLRPHINQGPCDSIYIIEQVVAYDKDTVSILYKGKVIRIKGGFQTGSVTLKESTGDDVVAWISVPYEGAYPGLISADGKAIMFKVALLDTAKAWWAKAVSTNLSNPFLLLEFREDGFRFLDSIEAYEKYEDEPEKQRGDSEDFRIFYKGSKFKFHNGICT